MIADWQTNAVLFADLLPLRHPKLFQKLTGILKTRNIPFQTVKGTRDVWIRDFAPVQTGPDTFIQFRYRPDYLAGCKQLITRPAVFRRLKFIKRLRKSKLVIDGGNIVASASVAVLTKKVLSENPDRNRSEIRTELRSLLDIERLIVIPVEPDDPIGHADGMARFLNGSLIVVNDYSTIDRDFNDRLTSSLAKTGLRIERLPYVPDFSSRTEIPPATGNYVNFLRVGSLIVMPKYGLPEDRVAARRLTKLIPDAEIVSVPCRGLASEGGALNCATWTVHSDRAWHQPD